jgi:hypothetical protein
MNARGISTDSHEPLTPSLTRESRSSHIFLSSTDLSQRVRSVEIIRQSTFAVVAQGLNFIRRKAPLHKLDRLARISFPLLFIFCNLFYWTIFIFYLSD